MENVILVIHLILALSLIAIVLLQRSEGGGLGMGGGGGVMSARGAATALGKVTWALAIGFLVTSMTLTVLSAKNSAGSSVADIMGEEAPVKAPAGDALNVDDLLPPVTDEPLIPPRAD